jgi:cytochrome c biogenesis protein CcmG/thiol:disulfide interchange protein DsbE
MTITTDENIDDDDDVRPELSGRAGRGGHTVRWASAVAATVVVALLGLLVYAKPPDPGRPVVGKLAPNADVAYATLDGAPLSLASLRGRYVMLNFFASWCVPCQQEHPDLQAFQARHQAIGDAVVVQVLYSDTEKAARAFRDQRGPVGPLLIDPDGQFALDYGVRGPPETFFISPDGYVLGYKISLVTEELLEDVLARARAGRP